jgi:hypothetical protein
MCCCLTRVRETREGRNYLAGFFESSGTKVNGISSLQKGGQPCPAVILVEIDKPDMAVGLL